jgi:hypothetical protein
MIISSLIPWSVSIGAASFEAGSFGIVFMAKRVQSHLRSDGSHDGFVVPTRNANTLETTGLIPARE